MATFKQEVLRRFSPPPAIDIFTALIFTLATCFWGDLFGSGSASPAYLASVLTSIGLTLPLALRRSSPLAMVAIMSLSGAFQVFFLPHPTWALIATPLASYSVARHVEGPMARLVVASGAIGSVVFPIRWAWRQQLPLPGGQVGELLPTVTPTVLLCMALVIVPYLLGRRDQDSEHANLARAEGAKARYESELALREEAERATENRVRNEIARELHDIVAHSLSVIVVQAEGGKALARKHPEKATEVLDTISSTGREALVEMRRIVGVLRGEKSAEFTPSPGLADIETLVERAGDRANLTVRGQMPKVSPAVGLALYRVTQEAMTNVMKHAGSDAKLTVGLRYSPTQIEVSIYDDGGKDVARPAEVSGTGYGIHGMRERVQAVGGKLNAGPLGAGWLVQAVVPVAGHIAE